VAKTFEAVVILAQQYRKTCLLVEQTIFLGALANRLIEWLPLVKSELKPLTWTGDDHHFLLGMV
jgi:hypothetical protein